MTGRRLLAALGTTACVAAVIARAVSAAFLAFDKALSEYAVEIPPHVPDAWVRESAEWVLPDEDDLW